MNIAVNARFLIKNKLEGFGQYSNETLSRIVKNHPEHQFFFFFDRPFDKEFVYSKNVIPIVISPPARHPLLFKIWFDYRLPLAFKKYKCDAFISPDGYCSLRSIIPQLAIIHDLNFEHNPNDFPKGVLKYLKSNFPKFVTKASRICTVSNFSKEDICQQYNISSSKIDITYNAASPIFVPISEKEKNEIQKELTDSNPYILFVGSLHKRKNIQRLLNAFSTIKQNSEFNHHLVIVGEKMWKDVWFKIPESIQKYVHFTGHITTQKLAKVTAGADLLTFVSYFEGFGIPIVEAMQSGTPVLCGNLTALPEIGGDAVQYCDPFSEEDISNKILFLLQNPSKLEDLKMKGLRHAQNFSWDNTSKALWDSFSKMMEL